MSDISVFIEKDILPTEEELKVKLESTYSYWKQLREFVMEKYPEGVQEWFYGSKKAGWVFRIKDKKRAILYLMPREGYFGVSFVFGQKAVDVVLESDLPIDIKTELQNARAYMEGRGLRIDVRTENILPDIQRLIDIKLTH